MQKHLRQTASLLLLFSHHPLCCVCVCECLRLRELPVNHSLSHWISRMGDCVNADGGLGPFETSPMVHLSPHLSSASFLYLIMFVHVPQSAHKSPLLRGGVFYLFFYFDLRTPAHLDKSQLTYSILSLSSLFFLISLLLFLSFFFPYSPSLIWSFFHSRHPELFFSFLSAHILSCPSCVCCLMFHSVSASVVPLDLLFFLFSFSCRDASS